MINKISLIFLTWTIIFSATVGRAQSQVQQSFSWYCHGKDVAKRTPSAIKDAEFTVAEQALNLFYQTDQTCWFKLIIDNQSSSTQRYYLEHRYPLSGELVLFHQNQEAEPIGFALDFRERRVSFANPTFQLDLTPGKHEILVRMESQDIMRIDFAL